MTVTDIVNAYVAAWHEPDEAARRALLDASWADIGEYCDPNVKVEGRDALVAHIARYESNRPGHVIAVISGVDEHHGYLRFSWSLADPDGQVIMEGIDVGEVDADGRLVRVTGSFGPPPAA